jgi:preprotein translocase subunit SecD
LTGIILLTVVAFLAVFKPVTFAPRKDPSDTSQYLQPIGSKYNGPATAPDSYGNISWMKGKYGLYFYVPQHDLRLGLDLRGGMRVVLQIPNRAEYAYTLRSKLADTTEAGAKQAEISAALAAPDMLGDAATDPSKVRIIVTNDGVKVMTLQVENQAEALDQLAKINSVMDKAFGAGKYVAPDEKTIYKPADTATQNVVLSVMEKRLNPTGTMEINTYNESTNRVVLEIPGVKDPERVRELIGTMAQMEFRLIPKEISVSVDDAGIVHASTSAGKELTEPEVISASYLVITGDAMEPNSQVTGDPRTGKPEVTFSMHTAADAERFGAITGGNIGRQLAIVLDGHIISAPVIQARITKNGVITGSKDMDEAKNLSVLLNAGALPVPVTIMENRTISASLGADSVAMSVKAGIIGLLAVLIFMFGYYRLPGLMANFALGIYIVLTLFVMWGFQATLTLPGIAGLIISIGMAVDANVIIFERLKEELRTQKPLETAIDVAFSRAWTAIMDSNVASLITGSVLYWLGTGAVRGFAVTLLIGVCVSIFTAVFVTRLFMKLMVRSKSGHNLAWYGL